MTTTHYRLNAKGEPEACDLLEWARWLETADRTVALTEVGDVRVSTVFLGLDHNFTGKGPAVLWETMVFGGPLDGDTRRYASKAAAVRGHDATVAEVQARGIDTRRIDLDDEPGTDD